MSDGTGRALLCALLIVGGCSSGSSSGDPACSPDPCAGVTGTRCFRGRCLPGELTSTISADGASLSGGYTLNGGGTTTFSAEATAANSGTATFTLGEHQLTVSVGSESATLDVDGLEIDGRGPLSPAERERLEELGTHPAVRTLALVPLELGCQPQPIAPAALAALILPWQIGLKYGIQGLSGDPRGFTRTTRCRYFADEAADAAPAARRQGAFLLSQEAPFPVVFGFSTLDVDGWDTQGTLATSVRAHGLVESALGPNGSRCRGACGADCPEGAALPGGGTNCEVTLDHECLEGGLRQDWVLYRCGSHPACVMHDQCYDDCAAQHPGVWNTKSYIECMHFRTEPDPETGQPVPVHCDQKAHDYAKTVMGQDDSEALKTCQAWATGQGPFVGEQLAFSYKRGEPVKDPETCPAPAADAGAGADAGEVAGCWFLCSEWSYAPIVQSHWSCFGSPLSCLEHTTSTAMDFCSSQGYRQYNGIYDTRAECQQVCRDWESVTEHYCDL